MDFVRVLGCTLLILYMMQTCHGYCKKCRAYYSCKKMKRAKPKATDGEYKMKNSFGQIYWAFCEFHDGYGYMFISRLTHAALNMNDIEYCKLQVLVRHRRSNSEQFDTRMGQIPAHSDVSLSIQYNKSDGYKLPQNYATMAPYIYLGFLPSSIASQRNKQGYSANGRAFTFTNCDSNPNSYLAFFFNKYDAEPTSYHTRCCYSNLMRNWIDESVPAYTILPPQYFFPFEMHMGGCGGYAINGYSTLKDISGAALGIRFAAEMDFVKVLGCTLLILYMVQTCHAYYSCKEMKKTDPKVTDGDYEMTNSIGQTYWVFCEFHDGYGYMFISKCTFAVLDMNDIEYCKLQVLVRHRRLNRQQFDTRMGQIPAHSDVSLSIQYNKSDGYNPPQNYATMAPYIYLGFLPSSIASQKNKQGYSANGRAFTFTNSDSNPNSYLAFFFNKYDAEPTSYHTGCCYTKLMRNWIDESVPAYTNLSSHYFFPFEMHMGGGGGYAINGYSTLKDISGAALGIRFEF
ncbi:uncharacterized protein LOC123534176 [Mercenaria mercenaria]|uniref:uncharacterized protein LOC123534176 n=1 Tax=Mercenaria mercenaria TaxID=6596 RepID=UPI00234FABE3|nr:uncharacterized protein LOC123534176 [Mercenaria mercenaria]